MILAVAASACHMIPQSQEKIAGDYMELIFKHDYNKAYDELSLNTKNRVNYDSFIHTVGHLDTLATKYGKEMKLAQKYNSQDARFGVISTLEYQFANTTPENKDFIFTIYILGTDPTKVGYVGYKK
jgi:hypothetical protein